MPPDADRPTPTGPLHGYVREDVTPEQVAAEKALYGPLTDAVRELVEATVRTEVDAAEVRAVTDEVRDLVARLRKEQMPGPYGVRFGRDGTTRNHGNAVVGLRNAVAPPVEIQRDREAGRVWADVTLGAQYEGPPGLVHGGVSALLLDQVAGEAAAVGGRPGMTGTLTVTYHRGTRLGAVHLSGWTERVEGVKTYVRAQVADAEGPTVSCEGIFILPRWARERSLGDVFE